MTIVVVAFDIAVADILPGAAAVGVGSAIASIAVVYFHRGY